MPREDSTPFTLRFFRRREQHDDSSQPLAYQRRQHLYFPVSVSDVEESVGLHSQRYRRNRSSDDHRWFVIDPSFDDECLILFT